MGLKHITWNPNDKGSLVVLSNSNMTATTTGSNSSVRATDGVTEGKWYWENTVNAVNSAMIGIMSERLSTSVNNLSSIDTMFYLSTGVKYNGSSSSYGASYVINDVIGVALDIDNGTVTFYKNGISQGVAFTTVKNLGKVFPFMCGGNGNPTTITANFGNEPFKYSIPDGYKAYADQYINKTLFQKDGKLYSLKSDNKIYETKMTSNTAPAPLVASASSVYSTTYPAWKAFNGTTVDYADAWLSASGQTTGWIQIDFGISKIANKVKIRAKNTATNDTAQSPKNINILGSQDGINFSLIGEIRNQINWSNNESREFVFSNIKPYRYYRLEILTVNGATVIAIGDILFSYMDLELSEIPNSSEKNFIKYGSNEVNNLELIHSNKNYILQDTVSENEQGLWTTQLNRKPLSIKFD